jgi:hypothetical protein
MRFLRRIHVTDRSHERRRHRSFFSKDFRRFRNHISDLDAGVRRILCSVGVLLVVEK